MTSQKHLIQGSCDVVSGNISWECEPHPAKFVGHKPCGSRNIMFLICHLISQDHVTQEPFDFIAHHPIKLAGHRHCGSVDIMILAYHVISQDHLIKGSCGIVGWSPPW